MPIPWLVVLQSVPWSDVIRNAPKVAENARKLWSTVTKRPNQPAATPTGPSAHSLTGAPEWEARIGALESTVSELHDQLVASSELIKALAEQNTQLVARIEATRVRMAWLLTATVVVAVVAIAAVALVWQRGS